METAVVIFSAVGERQLYGYNGYVMAVRIADLKNNLSRHLARVREGAELTVLDRDIPIARIVPFARRPGRAAGRADARQRLTELQRLGILGAGDPEGLADSIRTRAPVELPKDAGRPLDVLLQMRRETRR